MAKAPSIDGGGRLQARRSFPPPRQRRTHQIGQPLENVDADRALAADAIAAVR